MLLLMVVRFFAMLAIIPGHEETFKIRNKTEVLFVMVNNNFFHSWRFRWGRARDNCISMAGRKDNNLVVGVHKLPNVINFFQTEHSSGLDSMCLYIPDYLSF